MKTTPLIRISYIFVIVMIFLSTGLFAGVTGKIAGIVKDAETGEALPGCNIIVEGTMIGAASDSRGEYFIINVPPGRYGVRASMMGYRPLKMLNVQVSIDLTTRIDFIMQPTVLESNEEITIVAERPLVQMDMTSKLSVVGAEEIVSMAVDDFQDILTTKAGFTRDAAGAIHVRGGRSGEITYMIDGMYMTDPLHSGFSGLINKDAIDEMVILSGTFNAEYGDAMSSVVNIVTKEGRKDFSGKLEYTSPMLNESPYRQKNPFPDVLDSYDYTERSVLDDMDFKPAQLEIPLAGMLNSSLSGRIPFIPNLYFFAAGRYENEDSYLPHGYSLERDGLLKLTYRFCPAIKLSLTTQKSVHEYQSYRHSWKYQPDHQAVGTHNTSRIGLSWTHTINPTLFYTFLVSRFSNERQVQVGDKQPGEYERYQTGETVYFYVKGDDANFTDDVTRSYNAKLDVTWQANTHHLLKNGLELKLHSIDVYEEQEPWPSGAQFKEEYQRKPLEVAAYFQDKIEYDYLILNLGLRCDYADPKTTNWPNIRQFGSWDEDNNWIPAVEEDVKPKVQISPRIGLAHPITDRAMLHFSYGHFFQNPNYNSQYYNHHKDLSTTLPLVGNPAVRAQKTVAYETGIKYQLSENWVLDFTAWYKDITDLLSTLHISYLSQDYVVFYNSDYAGVKGIDLSLRKKYSNYISTSIDYSYSVAKGNNSQPLGGYFDAFALEEIPHQEFYLDFDQRHDFAANVDLKFPKDKGPQFAGFKPLSDFGANLLLQVGSGLPYTPYVDPTLRVEVNSGRKPWKVTADLRIIKKMTISKITTALFLETTNLFDRQNVVYVYSRTGKPFDTGLPGLVGSSPDANHNPLYVGPPRIIKAGVQFLW